MLPLIPEHEIYVEPFCGSAKLLFAKEAGKREVISDANGELITFFLVLKYRPSELAEKLHSAIAHPHWFKALRASRQAEDELERAFRFIYLNGLSFAGKGEHFGYAYSEPRPKKNLRRLAASLDALSERLAGVLIEKKDFADVIRRYDSPGTFFYCDPPYVDFVRNGRYDALSMARLDELFAVLADAKGSFLISEENHPEVAKRVRRYGFRSRQIDTTYTLSSRSNRKNVAELLIGNYEF